MRKTICIVHYNTPELTRAAVLSIRRHGGQNYRVVIFENSCDAELADGKQRKARPFMGCCDTATNTTAGKTAGTTASEDVMREALGEVEIIDNSRGQLVDFEAELARWPKKKKDSEERLAHFGSAKHMMSVEWLIQHMEGPFILADSDILLKRPIDDMFDESVTACGFIDPGWNNPDAIKRLWPMLCFINAPECRRLGIHYYDGTRCWGISGGGKSSCWYDTGAAFLEDIKRTDGATLRQVDIRERMEHMWSGSWREKDKETEAWLAKHEELWKPSPKELGIKDVAICCIQRREERYLDEFVEHHLLMGVKHIFIYDNGRGDEPVPTFDDERVTVVNWRDKDNAQCEAYAHCYRQHGHEYAWMGFLDVDEHVQVRQGETLTEYLNCMAAMKADVVLLNWRVMTDNGLTHYDPRPLAERFTQPMPSNQRVRFSDRPENDHVKSFVRGGLYGLQFGTPHCPVKPTTMNVVNSNGETVPLKPLIPYQMKHAWIDHFETKTAEEYMEKCRRGFPLSQQYLDGFLHNAVRFFFAINERTPEKEEILRDILLTNPKNVRIMEHVIKEQTGDRQFRLTAESGWLLKSVKTGKTYREIDTLDLKRWEVIEDKAAVAQQHTQQEAAAETKTDGKPQTKKRANRKGK